jgi:hypothetical protein
MLAGKQKKAFTCFLYGNNCDTILYQYLMYVFSNILALALMWNILCAHNVLAFNLLHHPLPGLRDNHNHYPLLTFLQPLPFFSWGVLRYFIQTGVIAPLSVFSDPFPGNKMPVHLLTAPRILFIWAVTHPSTNRAQHCLTSVIKWLPVCLTWQDTVLNPCPFSQPKANSAHPYIWANDILFVLSILIAFLHSLTHSPRALALPSPWSPSAAFPCRTPTWPLRGEGRRTRGVWNRTWKRCARTGYPCRIRDRLQEQIVCL